MSLVCKGAIFYIGSAPTFGCEQRPGRPAIIVSNDVACATSPVVEVVYLTTQPKTKLPTHTIIKSTGKPSTALCEQITSVSTDRLGSYFACCTDEEMEAVNECMRISLALKEPAAESNIEPTEDVEALKADLAKR